MNNIKNFINLLDPFFGYSDNSLKNYGTIIVDGAKCNLKCDYCFVESCSKESSLVEFNEQAVRSTLEKVDFSEEGYIELWAGEPLCNKQIVVKICNLINSVLPKVRIHMNTNGTLLDDWWTDYIIGHNIYVCLSHDGPGQKYRGTDYFELDQNVNAIKKLIKAGRLMKIITVIHKNNCNFNDIKDFFEKARTEKGIVPDNYDFVLVAPTIDSKIVYDFDPMDPDLIKYVQDSFSYAIGSAMGNTQGYSGMTSQIWSAIRNFYCKTTFDYSESCNEYKNLKFSINSNGEHRCIRGFFNRDENKKIIENHKHRCSTCSIRHACPICHCVSINVDDDICGAIKNRLDTVILAFKNIMDIWKTYESA